MDPDHGDFYDVGGAALNGRIQGGALGRSRTCLFSEVISGRYRLLPRIVSEYPKVRALFNTAFHICFDGRKLPKIRVDKRLRVGK